MKASQFFRRNALLRQFFDDRRHRLLDPTDIDIYRQLAGGLTASNLMHGSANTIGGQTQTIKLRWGGGPEDLVFEGAKPGIKFALGENVKRAGQGGSRYPGTRMGVEQVLRDSFQAAQEYAAVWRDWRGNPRSRPEPRRDLRLEALVEILERRRAVHIHSYRADEILMFARFAALHCQGCGEQVRRDTPASAITSATVAAL